MKTNFDHNSSSLIKGMGFTEKDMQEHADRLNKIATEVVHKQLAQTQLAEMLADKLSYNELLLLATISVADKIQGELKSLSTKLSGDLEDLESQIKQIKDLDEDALAELSEQGEFPIGKGLSMKVVAFDSEEGKKLQEMLKQKNMPNLDDLNSCKD